MLIDFFYTLRAAKLPVSVKEFLTLLEALEADVVGPRSDACTIDDFYFLSRTALVKDEKHFDKFDRAFAAYFKGVDMLADFTKEIPQDWLRKVLERELTPEEKARHRRHQPIRARRLQPSGHPHRRQRRQQVGRQSLGPARLPRLRRHAGAGHPQHQGRLAAPAPLCARGA